MSQRIIKFINCGTLDEMFPKVLKRATDEYNVVEHWCDTLDDAREVHHFLVRDIHSQPLIDLFQPMLERSDNARIIVMPVEATLPQPEKVDNAETSSSKKKSGIGRISREELFNDVAAGAELTVSYFLLVFFSTIVAAVGLLQDDIAVIVGAMVIAPFLGPNLALALSTTLGERELALKAVLCGLSGILLIVVMGALIGMWWPFDVDTPELMRRTEVGFASILLALSAGSAAVLSLTKGVSSVLVGVMVAVALVPPVVTCGLMLGAGEYYYAEGAAVLFAVNIACINIAANVVFLLHGVTPYRWNDKKRVKRSSIISLSIWVCILLSLSYLILTRQEYFDEITAIL